MNRKASSHKTYLSTLALTLFCADYHSGQSSRGYRIMGRCLRRMRRWGYLAPLDHAMSAPVQRRYRHLVARYRQEV